MGRSRSRDGHEVSRHHASRRRRDKSRKRSTCSRSGSGDDLSESDDGVGSDLAFFSGYGESERHVKVHGCCVNGKELVLSIPQSIDKVCTILWPSSVVLAELVATELRGLCEQGSTILELGCGSAMPSMVAAFLGAKALATDLDITSAEKALARNQGTLAAARGCVDIEHLTWGTTVPQHSFSAVLVADALYKEACLVPLATQLAALVAASSRLPRILLAYQRRDLVLERRFFGPILGSEALCSRELSIDALDYLHVDLRTYIRVVEIYPKSSKAGDTST